MSLSLRRGLRPLVVVLACAAAPAASAAEALLLNVNADFVRLDLATGEVGAMWQLGRIQGVGELVPEGVVDGQRVEGAAYDGVRTLFLVLPVEARLDGVDGKHYRVVALSLPGFELLGSRELPDRHLTPPAVVFRPSPRQLLVQYDDPADGDADAGDFRIAMAELEIPTLQPVQTLEARVPRDPRQRAADTAIPLLTDRAEAVSEDLFLENGWLVRLRTDTFEGTFLQPLSVLRSADQALLAKVAPPLPETGRPRVSPRVVAKDAGQALVQVRPERPEDGDRFLYFVFDPVSGQAGPAFLAPRSIAGLVAGRVVLQEYAGAATTGRVEVYEAGTGERLDAFASPLLAGTDPDRGGILCGTAGGLLLRGPGGSLRIVDLEKREVSAPATSFLADSWTHCFVIDGAVQ